MYCLVPEKPLRLVYGIFYLAIAKPSDLAFHKFINIKRMEKKKHKKALEKLRNYPEK